ncbi:MAG: hypothetical protein UY52_C0004G0042 [Parcubacteria group bacterium GW2011_GWC2_49_9]|nr:MAG: hypothetical protein UY52_C0004G0042 [Parcubacteria group bacterium GW2011_GWC2_49_9]
MSERSGMETLDGKVVAMFPQKGCIAVKLFVGTLVPGAKLDFSKPRTSGSEGDFELQASVVSIEVDRRPVNAIRVVRNKDGSKHAEVIFQGSCEPTQHKDRRCGIRLSRGPLPPNNASVLQAN